jgi:glutamate-5-semialdehyde dehydrogenase
MAISQPSANLEHMAQTARRAASRLTSASTADKNRALERMADLLIENESVLLDANEKDLAFGREKGISQAMLDRSALNPDRIADMASALREVAMLSDPVGEITDMTVQPNELQVGKMRIPLGVILMIYEARPNVTADAAALCMKSGNAVILRGGSEAFHSNTEITNLWHQALEDVGLPKHAVQLVGTTDRAAVGELLQMEELIDLVIPRGGEGLIRAVVEQSKIPVIKHYKGVCHLYVDADADLDMAIELTINSKIQRPSVCNSLETVLIHQAVAEEILPNMIEQLRSSDVEVRGCERTQQIAPDVIPANESDWSEEYLDYILSVKVVDNMDAAIDHIERYGSLHTETIVTRSYDQSQAFLRRVNSSCVMVNASTRFNDGGQLGLGAEIGISTSKLHAFGPMGLRELTTQKFIVLGQGQIRA